MTFLKQFALISTLVLGSQNLLAADYVINWKINHTPQKYFDKAVSTFKTLIEEKTNGRVTVKAIKSTVDGKIDNRQLLDDVKAGRVEMAQVYTTRIAETMNKEFFVFDLPYLINTHRQASNVFENSVGERLLKSLVKYGVRGLGFTYSGGYVVHVTEKTRLENLRDFKGTAHSNYGGYINEETLKTVGARSVKRGGTNLVQTTTYADLANVFDFNDPKQRKNKVINETGHRLLTTTLVINDKFYSQLPSDLQKAVKEVAVVVSRQERENIVREGQAVRNVVTKNSIPIVKLNSKDVGRWKSLSRTVYDRFYTDVANGRDLVTSVKEQDKLLR